MVPLLVPGAPLPFMTFIFQGGFSMRTFIYSVRGYDMVSREWVEIEVTHTPRSTDLHNVNVIHLAEKIDPRFGNGGTLCNRTWTSRVKS